MKQTIFYICIICLIIYENSLSCKYEFAPGYGEQWIQVDDDEGNTHVMNFSVVPNDTRDLMYGDAYYYLYTRNNLDPEELYVPDDGHDFTSVHFNSSNPIKVVTHGWFSSQNSLWLLALRRAFLEKGDYNVIIVDWSQLARNPNYPWAAFCTRYVGKRTAELLNAISETNGLDGSNIHLIGHSLGSHVMGYTGLFSNVKIYRISGLDPARPFFEWPLMSIDCRLDKTDANFVDIMHTSGGLLGYGKSHGHADYYPNNGRPIQPGCEGIQSSIEACSHARACLYFIESVNGDIPFKAYRCDNWDNFENGLCKDNFTFMGYPSTSGDFGDYYLETNAESPFAQSDN